MLSTHHKYAAIEANGGLVVRTADSLKGLITELMLNSGEDIALWSEQEAKRCADIWRQKAWEMMIQDAATLFGLVAEEGEMEL